jgi:hypothetical protein
MQYAEEFVLYKINIIKGAKKNTQGIKLTCMQYIFCEQ